MSQCSQQTFNAYTILIGIVQMEKLRHKRLLSEAGLLGAAVIQGYDGDQGC